MKKTFFSLAGFLLGMMFVIKSSSGYISILIPTPAPLIQEHSEKIKSEQLLPAVIRKSAASKVRLQNKQKASESYANQLSALRYVMRSA